MDNFRANKVIFSMFIAMSFISLVYVKNVWLKLFILWTVIRTGMNYNAVGHATLMYIFLYILLLQVAVDKLKKDYLPMILNTICIMALLQTTMVILNHFGVWFLILPIGAKGNVLPNLLEIRSSTGNYITTGFLSNLNMSGAFLALCLPAFFRKRWLWLVPLIFVGVYISKSLGGIVPAWFAVGAIILWKVYGSNKTAFFALIGMIIAYIFYLIFKENSPLYQEDRFKVWGEIWKYIVPKKLVVGWGVGSFKQFFPVIHRVLIKSPYSYERWLTAHNEPLQLLVEQGLIGLTLMAGYIGGLFRRIPTSKIAALAIIAIMVGLLNSGVNFLFHTTGGIIFLTWVIILEKEKNGNEIKSHNM